MNAAHRAQDSVTMLRRQLVHIVRYPIALFTIGIPVIILLLFVYAFGGTMGAGIAGVSGGRADYLTYLVPEILMIAVVTGSQMTAIAVSMDMTEGIIVRFRTMSISRSAVALVSFAITWLSVGMGLVPRASRLRATCPCR